MIHGKNSSGAARKAKQREGMPKDAKVKVVVGTSRLRVIAFGGGYNVQSLKSNGRWGNRCFKSQRDDALAEYGRLRGLVADSTVFDGND